MLDALRLHCADAGLFYWQNKSRREVDFVIRRGKGRLDLVECKINPAKMETTAIEAFRSVYAEGTNYIVSPRVKTPYRIRQGNQVFTVCTTKDLS